MTGAARGVVVLGMGRSGTSAITGLFLAAGFYAGSAAEMMPADTANPAGYHENLGIVKLNDEILGALSGSWVDPPTEEDQLACDWAAPRCETALRRLLHEADGAPVALKDPRISVMMPVWDSILARVLQPVLAVRHPMEVALSLERRYGTPRAFGLASWELTTSTLLAWLRGRMVTVAPYEGLMVSRDTGARIVDAAVGHLEPSIARRVRAPEPGEWLRNALHRQHAQSDDHLTLSQLRLWQFLSSLEPGDCELDPPARLVRVEAGVRASAHAEASRLWMASQAQAQQQALDQLRRRVAECEQELAQERDRAAVAERARRLAERELAAVPVWARPKHASQVARRRLSTSRLGPSLRRLRRRICKIPPK